MTRGNEGRRGYTLVEVLVALVVLSVALASMVPVLVQTTRGNSFGRWTTQAATFSQDKLEELRQKDFSDPFLAPGGPPDPNYQDAPANGFTRTWTINNCGTDARGIEVSTIWNDTQGGTHMSRFFTVRSNIR